MIDVSIYVVPNVKRIKFIYILNYIIDLLTQTFHL